MVRKMLTGVFVLVLSLTAQVERGRPVIQEEGVSLPIRAVQNFIGAGITCADNASTFKTECTVPAIIGGAASLTSVNALPKVASAGVLSASAVSDDGTNVTATNRNLQVGVTLPTNSPLGTLAVKQVVVGSRAPTARVSFTIDDGFVSTSTIMLPVFQAQGEVAASAPITDLVGTGGRLTWVQLQALQTAGWEILSHGKTHTDLTTLSEADIIIELSSSKTALASNGLTVNGFVYPAGSNNALVRRLTRSYYSYARTTTTGPNPLIVYQYQIYTNSADDHTQLVAFQTLVDAAETAGAWINFSLHDTDANDAITIDSLIDYIQAKGIPIVTPSTALTVMGNVLEVGDNIGLGERGLRLDYMEGLINGSRVNTVRTLLIPGGASSIRFVDAGGYIKLKDSYLLEGSNILSLQASAGVKLMYYSGGWVAGLTLSNAGNVSISGTASAAPGGTIPAWKKYSVVKIANGVGGCTNAKGCWSVNGGTAVNAATATTQVITWLAAPANAVLQRARWKTATACAGLTAIPS